LEGHVQGSKKLAFLHKALLAGHAQLLVGLGTTGACTAGIGSSPIDADAI